MWDEKVREEGQLPLAWSPQRTSIVQSLVLGSAHWAVSAKSLKTSFKAKTSIDAAEQFIHVLWKPLEGASARDLGRPRH